MEAGSPLLTSRTFAKQIKEFEVRIGQQVLWYALIAAHPVIPLRTRSVNRSFPPPKDRKTKRSPDDTGKICFSDTPCTLHGVLWDTSVPRVGLYQVKVWLGDTAPIVTGQYVDVRKAFPFGPFLRREDRPAVHAERRGDSAEGTEPPKIADGKKIRATSGDRTAARARSGAPGGSELVPAVVAQRAPEAELDRAEEEVRGRAQRLTKERTDLLATISREQTLHRDSEQSFCAPRRCQSASQGRQLVAAASGGEPCARRTGEETRGRFPSYRPRDGGEKDKASVTRERDALTKERDELL